MQHSEKKQPVSVKKLLLILIGSAAGLAVLIAGGTYVYLRCAEAGRDREEALRTERAQGDAARWVQEKYGFTPEITDVDLKRDGALFDSYYTGTAIVWASDGDNSFRVLVGEGDEHTGDDYQHQEIEDALLEEVNGILSGGKVLRFEYVNKGNDGSFVRKKFTGDNLKSILPELMQLHLKLGYVNTEFANAPDFPILRDFEIFTEMFSFDSAAHLADALQTEVYFRGEDWAPMLTGGLYVRVDGSEAFSYDVMDCGDFKVMYSYEQEGAPPKVTLEDGDAVIRRFREQYPNTDLATGTAHGWKVVTGGQAFYLYYPVHGEIPTMRYIDAVVEAETADESTYFQHSNMYAHGDYYVLECNYIPIHRIAVIE